MTAPELPEPSVLNSFEEAEYSRADMHAFYRQGYEAGMERAAAICDGIGDGNKWSDANDAAEAIRREASKPPVEAQTTESEVK
jgi:hypothetical protein